VTGGDGSLSEGDPANLVLASSSLTENLNKEPFLSNLSQYTNNSPALSDPNSPLWEYRMIYTAVVSNAAFGASGFGSVTILGQDNSPNKLGAAFAPTNCPSCVTNTAVATIHSGANTASVSAKFTVCTSYDPTLPAEPAPRLTIQRQGADRVLICWPVTCRNFQLQETPSLNPVISWLPVGAAVTLMDGRYCVSLPIGSGNRFFRLRSL
jgi:hypothetical protein